MPDLTIEAGWMCCSNEHWETEVVGSKGDVYKVTFGWTPDGNDFGCTCPQSRIKRRECKHIKSVKHQRCGWHQQFDAGDVDPADPKCPRCGGEVVAIRWAA